MPKRSTPFQAIVRLVRQHLAQPGVTVTESKFLRDAVTGVEREVDIVVEGVFDGEPMTISFEVVEHGRRASLPWVEQQVAKHSNLPTNRLILVSRSGFTKNAIAAIEHQAGRVQAIQPEVIFRDGQPIVKQLFVETMNYAPTRCSLHLHLGHGERIVVAGNPDNDVYDSDGNLLGPLKYLVQEATELGQVRLQLSLEAYRSLEKEQIKGFCLELPVLRLDYHLQHTETGALHMIEVLEIWGDFSITRTEISMTLTNLGGRIYGAGEVIIEGQPTVWVGTTDQAAQTTTFSWQVTGQQGSPMPSQPIHFPGLLKLYPPEEPAPGPYEQPGG